MISLNEFLVKKHTVKNNFETVDLGLPSGTKWATCNLGANNPTEIGDYYSWGELESKDTYSADNYKFKYNRELTKYSRFVDNLKELEQDDDIAYSLSKGKLTIPTREQANELKNNTDIEWTDNYNGSNVAGFIRKSKKNKNHIFFPCTKVKKNDREYHASNYIESFGCWLKDLGDAPGYAYSLIGNYRPQTNYSREDLFFRIHCDDNRYYGKPIRPVSK